MSNMSLTQVQHGSYKDDTSTTRVLQEPHECNTSGNFDFDNDTSENIFIISCMANENLHGDEQSHSKNYLLEMPRSHAKMHLN